MGKKIRFIDKEQAFGIFLTILLLALAVLASSCKSKQIVTESKVDSVYVDSVSKKTYEKIVQMVTNTKNDSCSITITKVEFFKADSATAPLESRIKAITTIQRTDVSKASNVDSTSTERKADSTKISAAIKAEETKTFSQTDKKKNSTIPIIVMISVIVLFVLLLVGFKLKR